jgi:hypothetical protein
MKRTDPPLAQSNILPSTPLARGDESFSSFSDRDKNKDREQARAQEKKPNNRTESETKRPQMTKDSEISASELKFLQSVLTSKDPWRYDRVIPSGKAQELFSRLLYSFAKVVDKETHPTLLRNLLIEQGNLKPGEATKKSMMLLAKALSESRDISAVRLAKEMESELKKGIFGSATIEAIIRTTPDKNDLYEPARKKIPAIESRVAVKIGGETSAIPNGKPKTTAEPKHRQPSPSSDDESVQDSTNKRPRIRFQSEDERYVMTQSSYAKKYGPHLHNYLSALKERAFQNAVDLDKNLEKVQDGLDRHFFTIVALTDRYNEDLRRFIRTKDPRAITYYSAKSGDVRLVRRAVPLEIALSLPLIESEYTEDARSGSNAFGLTQFVPDTAIVHARKLVHSYGKAGQWPIENLGISPSDLGFTEDDISLKRLTRNLNNPRVSLALMLSLLSQNASLFSRCGDRMPTVLLSSYIAGEDRPEHKWCAPTLASDPGNTGESYSRKILYGVRHLQDVTKKYTRLAQNLNRKTSSSESEIGSRVGRR